jgi:hypothetical protein
MPLDGAFDREKGVGLVKSHPTKIMKPTWQRANAVVDLGEPGNLIRFCTFVTIGAVASSVVIGAC